MTGRKAIGTVLGLALGIKLLSLAGASVMEPVARASVFAVVCAGVFWRRIGWREIYLLACSGLLTALALSFPPAAFERMVLRGLDQASYLFCFFMALGLLQEAASTSRSAAQSGLWLTRQPPRRRFAALYSGAGLLSVVFNLGTLSIVAPMIMRGVQQGADDGLNPVRIRRQISALTRGFAWSVIWSPTAIAPVVVAGMLPGVDRMLWIGIGLAVWALMLVLAAAEDIWRHRHIVVPDRGRAAPPVPWPALLRLFLVAAGVFVLAGLLAWQTGSGFITGLLLACPPAVIAWQALQIRAKAQAYGEEAGQGRTGESETFAGRISGIAQRFHENIRVAVTLSCAGYIGSLAADLIPADHLAAVLRLSDMPDFLLLSLIPTVLLALSMMALSPVMTAVFLGGLFGNMSELPADPTLIALSISMGWALSLNLSPVATPVLMVARSTGLAPLRISLSWNAAFGMMAWLVVTGLFLLLTGGK